MKKMKLSFYVFISLSLVSFKQPALEIHAAPSPHYSIDWSKTTNWKLYYVRSHRGYALSLDTLKTIKAVMLNNDSVQAFLHSITEIPQDKQPVFMGYYVATCQLADGSTIKLELSQHGSFFREEKEQHYYQLAEAVQTGWQAYLTAEWRALEGINQQ